MKTLGIGALLGAVAAVLLYAIDRRSHGKIRHKVKALRARPKPQPNDATLAAKVESEVLGHVELHEGHVNVNAENGVVVLRGQLDSPELIAKLAKQVKKVQGVREVENLLHLPGAEAPMHQSHPS